VLRVFVASINRGRGGKATFEGIVAEVGSIMASSGGSGESDGLAAVEAVGVPDVDEKVLRKMNHVEWLRQFAQVLQVQPRDRASPMTPFRAGAIGRLTLASRYIGVLVRELHWLAKDNRELRKKLERLGATVPPPYDSAAEQRYAGEEAKDEG
jgi:hypothetical protein